ncbi:Ankyrin repeat domain containing protein [Pandoravirus neocaledonia]|uniref:Ankyrin repeat domain containing protein n=1 Tax=Pandoravirus neocaledonia TaxID=2107708 RepID=A0A2U7UD34_9VIRU|nr:Ankyrin repeat domain containing protein [Pandoravirus neocaledonia]AVK76312.1 Ankyrin repeat domain containing protein [Pandoravirus neocaledonia]
MRRAIRARARCTVSSPLFLSSPRALSLMEAPLQMKMAAMSPRVGTRDFCHEVVGLVLDHLDSDDVDRALGSGIFSIDADAERTRRRCQATKKRRLVAKGDLAALKRIRRKRNARFVLQDLTLAAKGGHLDAVIWLHKHARGGYPCRAIQEASAGGHLAVVKWLCEAGRIDIRPGAIDAAVDAAANGGHDDVVAYLAEKHDGTGTPAALFWAVRNGHTDVVQRLCAVRPENAGAYYHVTYGHAPASITMISGEDPEVVNAIKVTAVAKDHPGFGLFDLACLVGHMDIVRLLWQHGIARWTPALLCMAAVARGTDVVDFVYAHRPALEAGIMPDEFCYEEIIAIAICSGSVAKVAAWHWAMHAPFVLSRSDMVNVACRGHLDMFKFLCSRNAPVNLDSCLLGACKGGSIAVVTHLLDAGAAINEQAINEAASHGHSDIVRLLYARGGDIRVHASTLNQAVTHCDADVVAHMRHVGQAEVDAYAITESVLRGRADVAAALCDRAPPPPGSSCVNHVGTVACTVGHPLFSLDDTLYTAIMRGNRGAIDALLDARPAVVGPRPYLMPDHHCGNVHFDAVRRVVERCDVVWNTCDYTVGNAIMFGSARTARWFHARGILDCEQHDSVAALVPNAAINGHLSTVEFMWERGFRPTSMDAPLCGVCDDTPAEDHCAAQAFLRRKIAEAAGAADA